MPAAAATASAARLWLASSSPGYCAKTDRVGDCMAGDKGTFRLPPGHASWLSAARACLDICASCPRCRHVSLSPTFSDCSWFATCDSISSADVPPGSFRTAPAMHESSTLAVVATASVDIVSAARWRAMYDAARRVGDVYVGSTADPCPSCAWRFVATPPKAADERWGLYTLRCLRQMWDERLADTLATTFAYVRPDAHWLLPMTRVLARLATEIATWHEPVVFVPDTEHYWGTNDRVGAMNRGAARVYFTRHDAHYAANTESLLDRTMRRGSVHVRTFPTVATLACCAHPGRCYQKSCHAARSMGAVYDVKYRNEAQAAMEHAHAFRRANASWARCPEGLCARPPVEVHWNAFETPDRAAAPPAYEWL